MSVIKERAAVVLECIMEACRNEAPTPAYERIAQWCKARGVMVPTSKIAAALDYLESTGAISREGEGYSRQYVTACGITAMRESANYTNEMQRAKRPPTLEERAAWYGVKVQLTHNYNSGRPTAKIRGHDGYRWASTLA
ncbi:MAG TPA: hypothetical protein VN838_06800 [Bradyrhizobium sp.]|nr:hypothetical protein [Bradyrhizobium sp.]